MKKILIVLAFTVLHIEAKEVTFTEHVAPIIFQNCTSCHRPGESGPFKLMNYNDVSKRGKLIARVTEDRVMPPWHAQKGSIKLNGKLLSSRDFLITAYWVLSASAINLGTSSMPLDTSSLSSFSIPNLYILSTYASSYITSLVSI